MSGFVNDADLDELLAHEAVEMPIVNVPLRVSRWERPAEIQEIHTIVFS